jgi:predicted nucleic acid binding AN1-type Zn finger protein
MNGSGLLDCATCGEPERLEKCLDCGDWYCDEHISPDEHLCMEWSGYTEGESLR